MASELSAHLTALGSPLQRIMVRYFRLLGALARYGLARELTFRGNLLAKVLVEILWLAIMLVFYHTLFRMTEKIADWTEPQYMFFVGCYFALSGIIETCFMSNCSEFAEMVRSGDLDFLLLRPIDEQFLITCRSIDWSTAGNIVLGFGVMGFALWKLHAVFDAGEVGVFVRGDVSVWGRNGLQFPGAAHVNVGLAGPQSEPVRNVVAVHDADALSARDLRQEPGCVGARGWHRVHFRRARPAHH